MQVTQLLSCMDCTVLYHPDMPALLASGASLLLYRLTHEDGLQASCSL